MMYRHNMRFKDLTRTLGKTHLVASATAEAIMKSGFLLIPSPSDRLITHFTIAHPRGIAGFTDENLRSLSTRRLVARIRFGDRRTVVKRHGQVHGRDHGDAVIRGDGIPRVPAGGGLDGFSGSKGHDRISTLMLLRERVISFGLWSETPAS
jgi:hypothetical protein